MLFALSEFERLENLEPPGVPHCLDVGQIEDDNRVPSVLDGKILTQDNVLPSPVDEVEGISLQLLIHAKQGARRPSPATGPPSR